MMFAKMTTAAADMVDAQAVASGVSFLPGLIMPPGSYQYDATNKWALPEGLFHIIDLGPNGAGSNAGYRIVAANPAEPYALLKAIARLTVYGNDDEGLALAPGSAAQPNTALWQMRSRKLAMRCGPTNDLAKYIAGLQGVQMRIVRVLTDAPQGYDDGHVAAEVRIGGKWRFVDLTTDVYFRNAGEHVSLAEYIETGFDETVELGPSEYDTDEAGGNGQYHPGVWADMFMRTPEQRAAWRDRVFKIPGIDHSDGKIYWYLPPGAEHLGSWVLGLSPAYRVVSKSTWEAMFYP